MGIARTVLAAASALIVSGCASEQPTNTPPIPTPPVDASIDPQIIRFAQFERLPTGDDMAATAPAKARSTIPGTVLLQCVVTQDGLLRDCVVPEESPPNLGYAAAALKLARFYKLKPLDRSGVPVAGRTLKTWIRWVFH